MRARAAVPEPGPAVPAREWVRPGRAAPGDSIHRTASPGRAAADDEQVEGVLGRALGQALPLLLPAGHGSSQLQLELLRRLQVLLRTALSVPGQAACEPGTQAQLPSPAGKTVLCSMGLLPCSCAFSESRALAFRWTDRLRQPHLRPVVGHSQTASIGEAAPCQQQAHAGLGGQAYRDADHVRLGDCQGWTGDQRRANNPHASTGSVPAARPSLCCVAQRRLQEGQCKRPLRSRKPASLQAKSYSAAHRLAHCRLHAGGNDSRGLAGRRATPARQGSLGGSRRRLISPACAMSGNRSSD